MVLFHKGTIQHILFVLVFLLLFVVVDLEVTEFVRVLCSGHNTKPISEIVFLQVLLGQILQVALAEWYSGCKNHLVLFTAKSHILAKVTSLATNLLKENCSVSLISTKSYVWGLLFSYLNTLIEVGFKVTTIHDAVFYRMAAVD